MSSPGRKKELSEIEALVGAKMLINGDTDPVISSSELADWAGVSTDTARSRLNDLHDKGHANKKQIGARALVFWITPEGYERLNETD